MPSLRQHLSCVFILRRQTDVSVCFAHHVSLSSLHPQVAGLQVEVSTAWDGGGASSGEPDRSWSEASESRVVGEGGRCLRGC